MRQRVKNEDLSDCAACSKGEHVETYSGVGFDECESIAKFACRVWRKADRGGEGCGGEVGRQEEVCCCEEGAHYVLGAHHLRACKSLEAGEDLVLDSIREAVEEQVYCEQGEAEEFVCVAGVGRSVFGAFLGGGRVVDCED